MNSIPQIEQIRKFFFEKHFDFLTSVPQHRIQEIILASSVRGNTGKMSDYAQVASAHRTTYGHFLSKGKWNDSRLEETHKRESFQTILNLAQSNHKPLFISIDDTVIPKTKPSSKAKKPTEGAGWHYSHLDKKTVYGYQIHATMISTENASLCYSLKRCCKEHGTKIEMALNVINSIPHNTNSYVLMDSWYTNSKTVSACHKKGCYLIGVMKTNRILYPNGQRISASDFATSLTIDYFHPVTVKGQEYMVYRYEGPLNKITQAVVLLSYPKQAFGEEKALKVFLCTDMTLSNRTILEYYTNRWNIEVMFRTQKRYMGFKGFMVRTTKALDRLLIILSVAHFFFCCGLGVLMTFSDGLRTCRDSLGIL